MVEAEVPSKSPLWYYIAALAAILPAIGTAAALRGVINAFQEMTMTGSGGIGSAVAGMYEANRLLIVAAIAAAALAGWLAVTVLRKPQAFPGLLLSLAPVLGCVPAFFLWMVESTLLEVLGTGRSTNIAEVSPRFAGLVVASFGGAIAVSAIVIVIFVVSLTRLTRPRPTDSALPPAAVWATVTVLLIGLAAAFYMRSSYLYQVGQTGQL